MIKKIAKFLGILFLSLILFLALGIATWVYLPHFQAGKKIEDVDQYAKKVDQISLKEGTKIVGLGEASHGNVEFQSLKLDVLKNLVEKGQVHSFGLETDFGEGLIINDYIQGKGDQDKEVVKNLSFTIYQTKEMLDLIEWMRDYNQGKEEGEKISFYGFDMQNPEKSIDYILDFARENPSLGGQGLEEALSPLGDYKIERKDPKVTKAGQALEDLQARLQANMETLEDKERARFTDRAIENVLKSIEYYKMGMGDYVASNSFRDRAMADNVVWIQKLEEEKGHGALLIAGHNGHVAKKGNFFTPMGSVLKEAYGQGYFIIGTDYYKTLANISTMGERNKRGNHKFYSADPLAGQAKDFGGTYYLDFGQVQKDSPTDKLISGPMYTGSLGEGYSPLMSIYPPSNRIKTPPRDLYDSMIFVYEASPISPSSK